MAGDPRRQPKDFNHLKPEATDGWRDITDPVGAARQAQGLSPTGEYPKHLVRSDAKDAPRELEVAQDAAHEASLREDGYMTHHELDAVHRDSDAAAAPAKPAAAQKPRNAKPKSDAVN